MEQEHKNLLKRKRKRRRKHIFHITVFLIIISTLYLFNIDKNNEPNFESNVVASLDDLIPKHNYNWDNLVTKNEQKQYIDEDGNAALKGIDISKHQGDIDWSQVKDDDVDFAVIRAGYRGYGNGKIMEDDKFKYNIEQALIADLDVGVYFFSQAITTQEAVEEAEFLLNTIQGYNVRFPLVFDMEEIKYTKERIN